MDKSLVLKNLLFTLLVPGSVGVYLPLLLSRGRLPTSGLGLPMAVLLFAIGSALYLWAVSDFAARGRGTPLPLDAPRKLVIQGPYRYTRNPMYLGLHAALLGWLLLFQTTGLLVYLAVVSLVVNLFVIGYEEPHLSKEFGDEYEAYRASVPRWLPRFPGRMDA